MLPRDSKVRVSVIVEREEGIERRMPWSCDVCTYINEKETFLACEMCQTPRGSSKNAREAESEHEKETEKMKTDVIELEDTERKQKKMKTDVIELGGSTTEDER